MRGPNNRTAKDRTIAYFEQRGALGVTGIELEPYDKGGKRLGYVQISDGGIRVFQKHHSKPSSDWLRGRSVGASSV